MAKSKISAADKKDLEAAGYVEGQPNTIPDNISPVLKAQLMEEWRENNDVQTAQDMPNATEVQNELVRERAAADGDEDMQKVTGTGKAEENPAAKTTGARRQNEVNK